MQSPPLLLPAPRKVEWREGKLRLSLEALNLDNKFGAELPEITHLIRKHIGDFGVRLRIQREHLGNAEAYSLTINSEEINIRATTAAGAWHGLQTLVQIARQNVRELPCVEIEDWPDFPNRGVMLDISRDKVPTRETLKQLIDLFSELKYNQLHLYTEHTFEYINYPEIWAGASPLTAGEIALDLDEYCRARHIELVPNQNSFGHMERWLKHPRLTHLAETPNAVRTHYAQTPFDKSFSLCPLDPGALKLLEELYAELLPNFSSGMFNVGCDETFELGQGRSREACEQRGKGRVYLDFLLRIYELVKKQGRRMMFWGDIIMQHPELIAELPRDVIALEWGYEADHPFEADTQKFAAAGIPFYVCPGTSSWNSLASRTQNALENLASAARHGLANGASGYLVTDWGDNGHWQYLPFSYLGFAAGAALSWCRATNENQNWALALDVHVFENKKSKIGQFLFDLGNLYLQLPSVPHVNGTIFARALLEAHEPFSAERSAQIKPDEVARALAAIDALGSQSDRELRNTVGLMRHSLHLLQKRAALGAGSVVSQISAKARARLAAELMPLIKEHYSLWLARNRPGGLRESAGRLERILDLYNAAD